MPTPIWINLSPGIPPESAFSSTRGLGTPLVIDSDSSAAYYINSSGQIFPVGGAQTEYLERISNFENQTSTPIDTELSFAPELSSLYVVEGQFLLETTSATKGPVIDVTLPSNLASAMVEIRAADSSSSALSAFAAGDASLTASPIPPDTPLPAFLRASFRTTETSSGNFSVSLSIEA
jgi:hypothetical protein